MSSKIKQIIETIVDRKLNELSPKTYYSAIKKAQNRGVRQKTNVTNLANRGLDKGLVKTGQKALGRYTLESYPDGLYVSYGFTVNGSMTTVTGEKISGDHIVALAREHNYIELNDAEWDESDGTWIVYYTDSPTVLHSDLIPHKKAIKNLLDGLEEWAVEYELRGKLDLNVNVVRKYDEPDGYDTYMDEYIGSVNV